MSQLATETKNLKLCKKNPETDGNEYFDIKTMLNDNWDKIDQGIEEDRDKITKLNNEVIHKLDQAVKIVNYPSVIEHFNSKVASPVDVSMDGKMVVNSIPSFTCDEWVINPKAKMNASNKITLVATGDFQSSYINLEIDGNTQYTMRCQINSDNLQDIYGYIHIYQYDSQGNRIDISVAGDNKSNTDVLINFTTLQKATSIRIHCTNKGAGTFRFENLYMIKGTYNRENILPYCESTQPLEHPYVKLVGENLIDDNINKYSLGNLEWRVGTNGNFIPSNQGIISPDGDNLKVDVTQEYRGAIYNYYIPVKSSTTYTISANITTTNLVRMVGRLYDSNKNYIGVVDSRQFGSGNQSYQINTNTNTKYLRWGFRFESNGATNVGTIALESNSLIINEGTTSLPYTPYKESLAILPSYLAEIPNTSYKDKWLRIEGTKGIVERQVERLKLEGYLDWTLLYNKAGYKVLSLQTLTNILENDSQKGKSICVKYNGEILNKLTTSTNDNVYNLSKDYVNKLQIAIPKADTGWGDSYTPTPEEIKAYMMGWRMFEWGKNPLTPYVSGEKAWAKINPNGTYIGGSGTKILPIESFTEWKPYELFYALETPYIEEIDLDIPFDSDGLTTIEGMNTVEVGSGLVWEKVKPVLGFRNTKWIINSTYKGETESMFEFKSSKVNGVFKNMVIDSKWTLDRISSASFGKERYVINVNDFDPQAEYYVLYEMLNKEYNNQFINAQIKYEENLRESHNKLVDHVGEVEGDVSEINKEIKDTLIKCDGERIEYGNANISISDANYGTVTIIFKKAFSKKPQVMACPVTTVGVERVVVHAVTNVTTTSALIGVTMVDLERNLKGTAEIRWLAIGK